MSKRLKNRIKILWGCIFYYSGIFFLIRMWNNLSGRRLTIVTYHRVTGGDVSKLKYSLPFLFISRAALEWHLGFYKRHYRLLNFEEFSSLTDRGKIPGNCLIISFDDGYKDNVMHAFPLMRKHNCPWVLFLSTAIVGSKETCWWDMLYGLMEGLRELESQGILPVLGNGAGELYERFKKDRSALFASLNELPVDRVEAVVREIGSSIAYDREKVFNENRFLSWDDVDAISPFTECGSHAHRHLNLSELQAERARDEIRTPKKIIEERTGKKVWAFSYPAGRYNESLKTEVEAAGYRFAVTTKAGVNDLKDPYSLKRINVWEGTVLRSGNSFSKGWLAYKLLGF